MNKFSRGFLKLPKIFIKSLTNFKFYRTLVKLPISHGILYIIVISFLFSIISVLPSAFAVNDSVKKFSQLYEDNAPDFIIQDNKMTTSQGEPVYMIDDPGKSFAVIFDETDSISPGHLSEYESALLLDSDSLFLKTPLSEQDTPYANLFPDGMDKVTFLGYMGLIKLSNYIFIALFILFFIFMSMLGAFFIASIGNLLLTFKKMPLRFSNSFAIACYASTLPILFKTIMHFFGLQIMFSDVIYVLLGVLYFWNGTNTLPKKVTIKENKIE